MNVVIYTQGIYVKLVAPCWALQNVKYTLHSNGEDEEANLPNQILYKSKGETGGNSKSEIVRVSMPYVFRYLANELGAMNIK